uniref:Nidogen 2 n=1 Tax=Ornithorhynchus anatinus TaxID=9258 RepID=A0A6I8NK02_ORNAN
MPLLPPLLIPLLPLLLMPLLLMPLLMPPALALPHQDLFPYGPARADLLLQEGDDETSPVVQLRAPLPFYEAQFGSLYVGTNGIISTQDFPRETQYVDDDFPTDFPAIAPFLSDIDTSNGRGKVYYREDDSEEVLSQAARYVHMGFPSTAAGFTPTRAFVATWEDVGAYEELNTFQAVLAYDESDAYALFLYPASGLQFFGTRPKESYNVHLELPARVGFSRGEVDHLKREGPHFSVTSTEQSVKNLYQMSNLGLPGVWAFHIGSSSQLENVVPATSEGSSPVPPGRSPVSTSLEHRRPEDNLDYAETFYDEDGDPTWPKRGRPPDGFGDGIGPWHRRRGRWFQSPGVSVPVFTYSASGRETCERNHGQCSQYAFCTDYATGFCCHCQSKYYGDGKHCLPEGMPHRVNGKVSGQLGVGQASVAFDDVDLHAYIVGNDGRAYTAISHIPEPAAPALLPLVPIGGLFGWLFALEKPGYQNGFRIAGAEFTHEMEVSFHPGEEQVHITQTAEGLDPENYLTVRTMIRGRVPAVPENSTLHMGPYEELYRYHSSGVTSTASREYTLVSGGVERTLSYRVRQNFTYLACGPAGPSRAVPASQQLRVDRVFALYSAGERVLRFAVTSHVGPIEDADALTVNPCSDGTHTCHGSARCLAGAAGPAYTCECTAGFQGDGRHCEDVDECATGSHHCGPNSHCINSPGSYRCLCHGGSQLAPDGRTCVLVSPPSDPCEDGSHNCGPPDRARCVSHGGGSFSCECLPGYVSDGPDCADVDECAEGRCHHAAACHNSPGSFTCHCQAGYRGDGFQCVPGKPSGLGALVPSARPPHQYVPQCDQLGEFRPLQCHGNSDHCWCVGRDGRELEGTRSRPGVPPPCLPSVAPPTAQPSPRPDVNPPATGTFLLYAQGQQIGYLPLNGTRLQKDSAKTLLSLHGSIVVGIDYDCRDRTVYWTDVAGRLISRTSLEPGSEPETIINSGLMSPEGLTIDYFRRIMFWTDSGLDKIESAKLDGSERRVLFDTDLVNPRAITVDPIRGNLYWTDWNREAPKIEVSSVDGTGRRILVNKDIGLPNALTYDPFSKLICWADAGTKRLECTLPDGTGRRVVQNNLNYPFSIVSYWECLLHAPVCPRSAWALVITPSSRQRNPDGAV